MTRTKHPTTITEERLALDMAAVMRALVAAHRASAEVLELHLATAPTTPVIAPEFLTQKNVEHVAGIPADAYLDLLRTPGCPVHVSKIGKLRVVDRLAFLAWVSSLSSAKRGCAPSPPEGGMSVETFAAMTGMGTSTAPPRSGVRLRGASDAKAATRG